MTGTVGWCQGPWRSCQLKPLVVPLRPFQGFSNHQPSTVIQPLSTAKVPARGHGAHPRTRNQRSVDE